jgi:chemotaxis protein methyltransferase CheR
VLDCSETDWKLISEVIEGAFGLVFEGARRPILLSRIEGRLKSLRLSTVSDYYRYLRTHPDRLAEFKKLAAIVTNNETYFFRQKDQFELLVKYLFPRQNGNPPARAIRILVAACSSGEEAFSISITLSNAAVALFGYSWEIDGCDVSPIRIEMANAATYDAYSLRDCDEMTRQRYFVEEKGHFRLRDTYRKGVRFFQANLASTATTQPWYQYHAIYCRNVLIYFSERAFHEAISLFYRQLLPNGFLFLGHSESLIGRRNDFVPVSLDGTMVYRKVDNP